VFRRRRRWHGGTLSRPGTEGSPSAQAVPLGRYLGIFSSTPQGRVRLLRRRYLGRQLTFCVGTGSRLAALSVAPCVCPPTPAGCFCSCRVASQPCQSPRSGHSPISHSMTAAAQRITRRDRKRGFPSAHLLNLGVFGSILVFAPGLLNTDHSAALAPERADPRIGQLPTREKPHDQISCTPHSRQIAGSKTFRSRFAIGEQ